MLQIQYLRENAETVIERLRKRNFPAPYMVEEIIGLDEECRKVGSASEAIKAELKKIARSTAELSKKGDNIGVEDLKKETKTLKDEEKKLDKKYAELTTTIHNLLIQIPNLPYELVKAGAGPEDNEIVFESDKKEYNNLIPHWDIAGKLNIINFETGNKISGSGFPLYCGKGAQLQRALINFFLHEAEKAGFIEHQPPVLVNEASAYATGQLPDKEGQMYHIEKDNLYLIPTAEVPLTNIFRDEIIPAENLPIKISAYSPCFRREAGSYGRNVRGLNRLHQFDKVEIVVIEHPDSSYKTLEMMVEHVKSLIEKLELQYRILRLCGGDMGFTAAMTYDFEVYAAGQKRWLEVSSVSNFESFQSNRLKLRFKDASGKKTQLAHTLNGSALALPRIMAALLENHQIDNNSIRIPKALIPFTSFETI